MSFEHLPFSSFALESSVGPTPGFADGSTLTLDLAATVEHPLLDTAMRGSLALVMEDAGLAGSRCASVVPVSGGAMTLTF
jgi:hypothetical protein